jgi:pyrroline-5-carboxylate reductase
MDKNITIGLIGAGNMARALIGGLLASGTQASQLYASDAKSEVLTAICAELKVRPLSEATTPCSALIVAVKPADVQEALRDSVTFIGDQTVVLSIAAGIPTTALANWMPKGVAVVRAMPNTPALIGAGISGLFAMATVSAAQRALAEAILCAVGEVVWVESEDALDAITAVSGSGPAYLFYLVEAIEQAALAEGLNRAAARKLALSTCAGAARLAAESDKPPATLREQVTSKGGTTAAALDSLKSDGFIEMVQRAVHAARLRSEAMGRDYGGS